MYRIKLLPLLFIFLLLACSDKNTSPTGSGGTANNEPRFPDPDPDAPRIGGLTGATPQGGLVESAAEGPRRSAFGVPEIDLSTWSLTITGLVDSTLELTWPQIEALQSVSTDTMMMYCVEGWQVWGNWQGVPLATLFDMAGIQPGAKYALFTSSDGYTTSEPLVYLEKYNAILAYRVNGEYLRNYDGFPLRLVCWGKFGYKWAKWVKEIDLSPINELGYWERNGYDDYADVPMDRRIYYEGMGAEAIEY